MKQNEEMYDNCTCHKTDPHVQFCSITLLRNNVANVGIKLYNKFPKKTKQTRKNRGI